MADALTDILRSIHMEGSVFSRAELSAPWGVESGTTHDGVFHAVVSGRAWARLATGQRPVLLEAGDIVLFPFGDNHLITDVPDTPSRPIDELTAVDARGMGHLKVEGDGLHTSLICGRLTFDGTGVHPVFSVLPPIIRVRDESGRLPRAAKALIDLIAAEIDEPSPGSETVVARLTDVLLVYVLREHVNQADPATGGWLGALRHPGIAEALGHMHRNPERRWTAGSLAAAAGMSRSTFFIRFRELVGETPAEYLTKWRIHVASRMMRDEGYSAAAAGRRVGYRTEAAFSNAFLRVAGIRPGAYRRAA